MEEKNLIFILTDTLRRDKVSVYNDEIEFTENIGDFSEDAVVFEEAVANAPWTLPSHASIFTGVYPWEHGATQKNLNLDVESKLLAERLGNEGYTSACISVNGFLSDHFGLTKGFDEVNNLSTSGLSGILTKFKRRLDSWLSKPGMERIKRWIVRPGEFIFHYWAGGSQSDKIFNLSEDFIENSDDPFFLFVNLMDAHEPYFPPEEYRSKHNCVNPRTVCQDHTDHETGRKEADFEEIGKLYDACVDYMDDLIGEFFEYLKQEDLWENTVIIVGSDHGQMLGEDNHYGHQYSVAEPLVHVPLMIKGVDADKIEKQVELRELYDLIPEILKNQELADEFGTEYAMGGYEFPDMYRPRIPKDEWDKFYQRHHFVRTTENKVVRSEKENGEINNEFRNFNGSQVPDEVKKKMEEKLESISWVEDGEKIEDKSEEIQKKLRDLGYG